MYIKDINLNITQPIKLQGCVLENRNITILVGPNGSGKTLILILQWIASTFLGVYAKTRGPGEPKALDIAAPLFKHSFDNCDIDGTIAVTISDDTTVYFDLSNGIPVHADVSNELKADANIPAAVFMSKNIRLFDQIKIYLKMRKMLIGSGPMTDTAMNSLLDAFKIFDMAHIEMLIAKGIMNIPDISQFIESDNLPVKLEVDFEECDFIVTKQDGSKKYASTYSAGEQAIIHIFTVTKNT